MAEGWICEQCGEIAQGDMCRHCGRQGPQRGALIHRGFHRTPSRYVGRSTGSPLFKSQDRFIAFFVILMSLEFLFVGVYWPIPVMVIAALSPRLVMAWQLSRIRARRR